MLRVAIIGRPNVGKSTLFNRLTGTRHALVDDTPGVTRDRREGEANLGPLSFIIFDTAGLEQAEEGSLAARMTAQTMEALKEADAAIMVIDGRAGLTPLDEHFAAEVRKSGKPSVLLVNKAEGDAADGTLLESYSLGLGNPVAFSAEHGIGLGELYDELAPLAAPWEPDEDEEELPEDEDAPRTMSIAIVGRPNAGKSTLINQLLGQRRLLTGPEAGITRDSIAVPFFYKGREIKLVDTAGMRRRANISEKLEKLSVADTLRSIQYAEIVVLMMDATLALEKQDLQIADLVEQEGRALVLAINKWDLVPEPKRKPYLKVVDERMSEVLTQIRGVPVVTISAEKGKGLDELMDHCFAIYETWNKRVSTADLNRWLEGMLQKHTPPIIDGRRLKIRYMTQAKSRPPSFSLSANIKDIPAHYLRYLVGGLRETFALQGVPVRIRVRKSKNPYEKKKK